MATFTFTRAERRKAKLRLAITGPAGSGKTFTALLIAKGIGGRIALIDTEAESSKLYAERADMPEFDHAPLTPPYEPQRYIDAIKAAEFGGYAIIIVDSLSHAWAGEGGCLDIHGRIADSGKGNGYTAWRTVTPKHTALVEALLQSKAHIIATMRTKTDYVLVDDGHGKQIPRKVGMAPVQREGMDYEFTLVFDMDLQHQATASKDRTAMFADGRIFRPTPDTGRELLAWLESGKDAEPPAPADPPPPPPPENLIASIRSAQTAAKLSRDDLLGYLAAEHGYRGQSVSDAPEAAQRDLLAALKNDPKLVSDVAAAQRKAQEGAQA